MKSCSVF